MITYYAVLRPVASADLDTRPRFVDVLKAILPDWYVTFRHFKHVGKHHAAHGVAHA